MMPVETGLRSVLYWGVIVLYGLLLVEYVHFAGWLLIAVVENFARSRESQAEDYELLTTSRFTIPVSIIAPAYNEEVIILPAVYSCLGQDYSTFEVIVVSDGSTDGTLERLKREFDLKRLEVFYRRILPTEDIRAVYRSARDPRLVVIDKVNGGKADALNCGINLARYRYVCCVDSDTVYTKDALLKGMRLALKDPARVIAVTSYFSPSGQPETSVHGEVAQFRRSSVWLTFQQVEYLRAFINWRLAWSRLAFMLSLSGAFMIWRRDVIEELGGFAKDFSCEDLEVTFRAHEKYRRERKPYEIVALPDFIGHTEGPTRASSLISQRARWQRVMMETVWHYRRMLFNPRYGLVGMMGVPYYTLIEALSPFVQIAALVLITLAVWVGVVNWREYLLYVGSVCFLSGILTSSALLLQEANSPRYRLRDLVRLIPLGPLELLVYRPVLFAAQFKGAWEFLRGYKTWEKLERNPRPLGSDAEPSGERPQKKRE
jgi:biofilm PGA synthesis N-glycosyltransferase PgaC